MIFCLVVKTALSFIKRIIPRGFPLVEIDVANFFKEGFVHVKIGEKKRPRVARNDKRRVFFMRRREKKREAVAIDDADVDPLAEVVALEPFGGRFVVQFVVVNGFVCVLETEFNGGDVNFFIERIEQKRRDFR